MARGWESKGVESQQEVRSGADRGEDLTAEEREIRKKAIPCPKCSRPMPRWMSLCPDCVDKRQLFMRLLQRAP